MTVTFALHGYDDSDPTEEYGPLQAELERRGFPCRYIRSPRRRTKTPHRDRAQAMIEGLRDVEGEVALLGVSNQGLFLPLVAAARPVRRIVFVNACIPRPGRAFGEASRNEQVYANPIMRFLGWISPGMKEVCPLAELPRLDYVYVAGEKDDALRPEWEQWQAREFLHVEPVIIPGAAHSDIVQDAYLDALVDAATRDLVPAGTPVAARPQRAAPPPPPPSLESPRGLAGLVVANLAALAVYFHFHGSGASDVRALAYAGGVSVLWTVGASIARRKLSVLGLLGTFGYATALLISVFVGGGALPLKLHRGVVSGILGLVCLGSVAVGRPALLLLAAARGVRVGPGVQRRLRRMTLVIGGALLANAALQTALALTLSTGAFLVATLVVHVAVVVGLVGGLVGWLLWTGHA